MIIIITIIITIIIISFHFVDYSLMIVCVYRPSAVRFPRGNGYGAEVLRDLFGTDLPNNELPVSGTPLEIGKGRIIKPRVEGKKYRVALLSIGTRLHDSSSSGVIEKAYPDVSVTVADARFMKPLDEQMIGQLATENDVLITVEEGSAGGFDLCGNFLCNEGYLDNVRIHTLSNYVYIVHFFNIILFFYLFFASLVCVDRVPYEREPW